MSRIGMNLVPTRMPTIGGSKCFSQLVTIFMSLLLNRKFTSRPKSLTGSLMPRRGLRNMGRESLYTICFSPHLKWMDHLTIMEISFTWSQGTSPKPLVSIRIWKTLSQKFDQLITKKLSEQWHQNLTKESWQSLVVVLRVMPLAGVEPTVAIQPLYWRGVCQLAGLQLEQETLELPALSKPKLVTSSLI